MGLITLAYLLWTRKDRTFPRFVKTQLTLIVTEYTIATAAQAMTLHYTKQDHFDQYPEEDQKNE